MHLHIYKGRYPAETLQTMSDKPSMCLSTRCCGNARFCFVSNITRTQPTIISNAMLPTELVPELLVARWRVTQTSSDPCTDRDREGMPQQLAQNQTALVPLQNVQRLLSAPDFGQHRSCPLSRDTLLVCLSADRARCLQRNHYWYL